MTLVNPYMTAVPKNGTSPLCQARRLLEPLIAEHMEGFGDALEGRTPKDPVKRVQAHTMLRIALTSAEQSRGVAMEILGRMDPFAFAGNGSPQGALEQVANPTLTSNITSFITQMIHTSLDIFPRLLATNFVSIQPFTQPSGYVFFLHHLAKDGSNRRLDNLATFDPNFGDLAPDTTGLTRQVEAVGIELCKELVECEYKALMHKHSHEVDVALRSQYGLDIMAIGDMATADELAWEVDREVIDALVTFALTNPAGIAYFDATAGGLYAGYAPSEQNAYDQHFMTRTLTGVEVDMQDAVYQRPNWVLAGSNVIKLLARTPGAYARDLGGSMRDQVPTYGSVLSTGTLVSGAKVWHDPQLAANRAVVGHTNNMNPFWAGFIFSPFGLASLLTAAFLDPDNLFYKKARALAFAKVGVRSGQYRVIDIGSAS